ncbi:DNA-directed RNA polymerase subunit beta [Loigolactobacillus zhaoyuanensis]|uniref:DNA-directed RNA polymerase subunit beta n=1 Tax=Loigolactobacillus zhaoyuanensis TaxID=2486017 RepID=A0ABW8UDR3_9LACO|nr:DNA-directed RNA polymerase subunit beta [Loigolactobacillus zhaoyuanensis]
MNNNPNRFDVFVKPVLIRILLVAIAMTIAIIIGAMAGYAIGGGNPFRVFLPSTWGHLLDFVR